MESVDARYPRSVRSSADECRSPATEPFRSPAPFADRTAPSGSRPWDEHPSATCCCSRFICCKCRTCCSRSRGVAARSRIHAFIRGDDDVSRSRPLHGRATVRAGSDMVAVSDPDDEFTFVTNFARVPRRSVVQHLHSPRSEGDREAPTPPHRRSSCTRNETSYWSSPSR